MKRWWFKPTKADGCWNRSWGTGPTPGPMALAMHQWGWSKQSVWTCGPKPDPPTSLHRDIRSTLALEKRFEKSNKADDTHAKNSRRAS